MSGSDNLSVIFYLEFFLLFYSGLGPSYLTDRLNPRLVGAVEARNYVRSSVAQWVHPQNG